MTEQKQQTARDLARVYLLGELMSAAMKQLRALDKPWLRMPEEAQRRVIREVELDVRPAIEKAVELIASDGRTKFRVTVESVTFKDGVKAVMTMPNTEASHELADVVDSSVLVVIEDPTRYSQVSDAAPKADPDSPQLPAIV